VADVELRLKIIRENADAFKQSLADLRLLAAQADKPLKGNAGALLGQLKDVKAQATATAKALRDIDAAPVGTPAGGKGSFALGAAAGAAAFFILTEAISTAKKRFAEFLDVGDDFEKLKARTGESTEKLSALTFAAQQNNSDFSALSTALKFYQLNVVKAGADTGLAAAAFQALGLDITEIKKLDITTALGTIGDKIKNLALESEQVAITKAIFGTGAPDNFLDVAKLGTDGLEKLTARARELNIVTNDVATQGGAALKNKLKELSAISSANLSNAIASALPQLNELIDKFALFKSNADSTGGTLGVVFREVLSVVNDIVDGALKVGASLQLLLVPVVSFGKFISNALLSFEKFIGLGGGVEGIFNRINTVVLFLKDTLDNIAAALLVVVGIASIGLTAPFGLVAELVGNIVKLVSKDLGESIISAGKAAIGFSENMIGAGKAAFSAEGEVAKLRKSLEAAKAIKIDPFANTQFAANQGKASSLLDDAAQRATRKDAKVVTGFTGRVDKPDKSLKEKDTLSSRVALLRAELQAEFTRLEATLKAGNASVEKAFADGLVGIAEAYTARLVFLKLQGDLQRNLLEDEAKTLRDGIAKAKDEVKRNQLKAQLVQVEAKLIVLPLSLTEEQAKLKQWKKEQEDILKDLRVTIALEFSDVSGVFNATAVQNKIQQQFAGRKIKLEAELVSANNSGDTQAATLLQSDLARLSVIERTAIAQAQFNAVLKDTQIVQQSGEREISLIQDKLQQGRITELEATVEIDAAQKRLVINLADMGTLLNAAKDGFPPEAKENIRLADEQVQNINRSLSSLQPITVSAGKILADAFGPNNLANILTDAAFKVRSLKDGLLDMLKQVAIAIAKAKIAEALTNLAKAAGFSSGGSVPAAASEPVRRAVGGPIPGSGVGDTVPAMLTPGEFVNRVSSVNKYGLDFFHALNKGLLSFTPIGLNQLAYATTTSKNTGAKIQKFAEGGQVQPRPQPNFTIQMINNGTPQKVVSQEIDYQSLIVKVITEDVRRGGDIDSAMRLSNSRRGR
jgi:hypothetical protein